MLAKNKVYNTFHATKKSVMLVTRYQKISSVRGFIYFPAYEGLVRAKCKYSRTETTTRN